MSMKSGATSRHGMGIPNNYRADDVSAIETRLRSLLKASLCVIITDNTHSIISVKGTRNAYTLRLHHMFLDAPEEILASLAGYISGRAKGVRKRLQAFIQENEGKIKRQVEPRRPRKVKITTRGKHTDLEDSFHRLNRDFFNGRNPCTITWGNHRKKRRQKSVRLGSYSPETEIIRINRILDRRGVPEYVLHDVIYHEMLHHHLGTKRRNGRTSYHHEAFRKMEKRFPHTDQAQLWIRKNLHRLLCR